ncbi:hypothetical protein J3Q64DRAFT_1833821 [Phycomyces blakesleeanus]|uniref:Homeodomain-like DNA binding domain-containing transcription factor n=1 Tax=Phycomyces blakesleeanus TaxID=4837 RepID=A0ABR3B4Z3_PHYBL
MASTSDDLGYLICVLPNFSTSVVEEIFDNNFAFEDWVKENPTHYTNFIPNHTYIPIPTASYPSESNEYLEEFYNATIFDNKQDACSSSPLDEHHDTNHCSSSLWMNIIGLGSHMSEIISDNDMDTSSDNYMEDDKQEEMGIEHFSLSEEWMEKIRRIGNDSLSYVREYMEVDLIEKENEDFFGDAFLFAESMPLRKRHTALNIKTRGSYRKYTPKQVEKLFDLIIEEGFTTKAAALATGINVRTAQNYVKTYNNDPERRLPGSYSKPRGRPRNKLTEEHSKFLVDYIEKNTTAILDELKLKLCEKFEGLKISISAIHKHLVHKHSITLKKLEKIPAARNSDRVIALRKAIVE